MSNENMPPVYLVLTEAQWATVLHAVAFAGMERKTTDWRKYLRAARANTTTPNGYFPEPMPANEIAGFLNDLCKQAGRRLT